MKRTKLCNRALPSYTVGEEIFNTVSHIIGAIFGIYALISCIYTSSAHGNVWGIVSSTIYGASLICLYAVSGTYHGLPQNIGKKVMQVVDHCTIYFLIAGTYTPIVLGPIREYSPGWGWTIFGIVWGCAVFGAVFTAIDLKKYSKLSMICYLGMGWCIVLALKPAINALPMSCLLLILYGGIAYTLGAVLYGLGKKHRYMHSVFHMFVLLGSVLQYLGIVRYVL